MSDLQSRLPRGRLSGVSPFCQLCAWRPGMRISSLLSEKEPFMIWPFRSGTSQKTRSSKRSVACRPRRYTPRLELLENRALPSNSGFLQGTAFIDANQNNHLDAGEASLRGATIQLLNSNGTTLLATTTTDVNGQYSFPGLAPGTYQLVETPPATYFNVGAQALSQLDPASVLNASTIQVTIVDPTQVTGTFNSATFFAANRYEVIFYNLFGVQNENSIGQLPITLNAPGLPAGGNQILSLCTDLAQ